MTSECWQEVAAVNGFAVSSLWHRSDSDTESDDVDGYADDVAVVVADADDDSFESGGVVVMAKA